LIADVGVRDAAGAVSCRPGHVPSSLSGKGTTMTSAPAPGYRHTQKGPWWMFLYAFGAVMLAVAWVTWPEVPAVPVIMLVSGTLMLVAGTSFQHLIVADEGEHLAIRFGPLPLFRKLIRYEHMRAVERERTTAMEGWGVRFRLSGEQIWNIWGRDCVAIRHGETTLVGTDDADGLLRFLKTRLPAAAPPGGRAEAGTRV
jgi:hypothetical protein